MRKKRSFRKKILPVFTAISISILLGLFFFQQNTLVKQRNLLAEYTVRATELTDQNENLELGFIEKNHLESVETIVQKLNFEKAEKVHYIRVLGGTVVSR